MKSISSVTVIGAGQMGQGIAQVLAVAGCMVRLFDEKKEQCNRARQGIEKSLAKFVEKKLLSESDAGSAIKRLSFDEVLPESFTCDLVIEAIIENSSLKKELFADVSKRVDPETILATNTSSLSITDIASAVDHPERVIGMHFMNPVPLMKLVEIIRALQTDDQTYNAVVELCRRMDKAPITAEKDQPGFIVNRILVPMINEAFFVLMEGVASPKDIDDAMKLGTNQPMGPLELADFVGLDTCLFICETFHRELGEDKYRPCPLLRKYVEAGWYGRKAKKGVYQY